MRSWAAILLVTSVFALVLSFTEKASAEVLQKIVAIEVEGNQRVGDESVLANLETRLGHYFSRDRIRRDIDLLYKMGLFRSLSVETHPVVGGIKLVYRVVEKPAIGKITLKGNKKITEEKLREVLEVRTFRIANPSQIVSSVAKMREAYSEKGYHLAEISYRFEPMEGTTDLELVFDIKENRQVQIKQVHFIGNKFFSDKELRKIVRSREKGYWSWISGSGKFHEEMTKADLALLVYHYQNHGFLRVKVGEPRIYLSRDKEWIFLTYQITEGEQYRIKSIDLSGDILTTKEELVSKLKTKSGQLYSREKLETDLRTLSLLYGDQGYAFTNIDPLIHPDDTAKTAEIVLQIMKGSRIRIEQINVFGNTITRDKVIRRELSIAEGSYFHQSNFELSRTKLMQLGYFEEVNFATPRGSEEDTIVWNITVKEKPTGQFQIGAGYSSAQNFIFTASIAKDNFFGRGWLGQFSLQLSSLNQLFILSFRDRYFLDTRWIFGFSAFRTINEYAFFDRNAYGGSLSLGHHMFDHSEWDLTYTLEKVNVSDINTTIPAIFNQNLDALTSSTTTTATRDTRDNRLFPSKGTFHQASVEVAGLGGDTRHVRFTGNVRYYYPLLKTIFKFNTQLALTESFSGEPVPLFERFFMGGPFSLRGYFLRSVGPQVRIPSTPTGGDTDVVFGGNKKFIMNFEWELPIYSPAGLNVVSFIDGGNAFAESEPVDLTLLRWNYGFGMRWNSPMGPLRFEWGLPIDRQPGEDPVVFNFTIGTFF